MKFETADNNIIVRGIKCLDLDLTLDCGQAFRWQKQDDGSYKGVAMSHFLHIEKSGDDLVFYNTSEKVFNEVWRGYFDLDKDYDKICERLKNDNLLSSAIDEYYGIRILNQDSWEALVSFVISQQNNIKRIKLIISRLCKTYGEKLCDGWYSFPSAETCQNSAQKILRHSGSAIVQNIYTALQEMCKAAKSIWIILNHCR